MNLFKKQKQTHTDLENYDCHGVRMVVRVMEFGINMYTLLYLK